MSKTVTIFAIVFSSAMLTGCSSLNSTADKLGVNFWSHKPLKAPCKMASAAQDEVICVGTPLSLPSEAEMIILRGHFTAEAAADHNSHKNRNSDHIVVLAP